MDIFDYIQNRAKTEIEPVMEEMIPRDGKPEEVNKLIWEFLDLGGKRFRPVMSLLCCETLGEDSKKTIYPAVAIELFHNFTLIHDDIEDNSQMRRGKPCLHIRNGIPLAINAGDGLYNFVWETIINAPMPTNKKVESQKIIVKAFSEVLKGQATEIGWHHKKEWNIDEEKYLQMIGGKTGALIGASCEVGAYCGGATKSKRKVFREYGEAIGLAFQIQDDVLNVVGDFDKYKKEIGGDITEGKRTLMIIKLLQKATPEEKQFIIDALDKHTTNQQEIEKIIALMKKYKTIDYAKKKAYSIVDKAKKKMERKIEKGEARDKLLEIADFFLTRDL
ncbi:polyprenyl synthetase family protein [Candidatus Micrarchaeota archaeon]|jgi:geranylgeranyl pyrophosphate synthase|nr:polyprenyl synthetase family protein [Candidatus Micrarchaeota archaeon]